MEKWVGRGMLLCTKIRTEDGRAYRCMIDTGSENSSVPAAFESRLGARLGSGMVKTPEDPAYRPVHLYRPPRLYLGGAQLEMGRIVDTGGVTSFILGMDCLRHYCIQMDCSSRSLRFLDPAQLDARQLGKSYPLIHSAYAMIRAPALFGTGSARLLVDTGDPFDGRLVPVAFESVQREYGTPIPFSVDGVVKGNAPGMTECKQCAWEGQSYSDIVIGKESLNSIGMRFLARHIVTFDFPHHMVYLKCVTTRPLK